MVTISTEKRVHTLAAENGSMKSLKKERAKLRTMIMEGLRSGPSIKVDSAYWKKKRTLVGKSS